MRLMLGLCQGTVATEKTHRLTSISEALKMPDWALDSVQRRPGIVWWSYDKGHERYHGITRTRPLATF